ncbi:hypothetical protein GYMLUDRAFT_789855 [Collybiopsis luxurians FD-317 M1]|nr:hypothetical protein GYMLUDRAFT_789855 [Collybiopsis luxurians FD-317 M1]
MLMIYILRIGIIPVTSCHVSRTIHDLHLDMSSRISSITLVPYSYIIVVACIQLFMFISFLALPYTYDLNHDILTHPHSRFTPQSVCLLIIIEIRFFCRCFIYVHIYPVYIKLVIFACCKDPSEIFLLLR